MRQIENSALGQHDGNNDNKIRKILYFKVSQWTDYHFWWSNTKYRVLYIVLLKRSKI